MNETIAQWSFAKKVLGWCIIFGILFLLLWAGAYFLAGGLIDRQAAIFGLTHHECALIHYCGMGMMKILIFVFFIFPYLGINFALKKSKNN